MALEISSENIQIYKPAQTSKVKGVIDTDIIVPDSKPDVLNILQVNAISSVNEKFIQKDAITVSGFIDYTILYSGGTEDIEIKNIKHKTPFSQQIEAKGIDNDMFNYVIADVSHIDFHIQNSRKINVKTVLDFDMGIVGKTTVNAVSSITSSVNIPSKREEIKLLNMSVCQENKFFVSDEIKIPFDTEDDEILKIDCKIQQDELRCVNNKVIAKGTLNADILFTKDGDVCHIENEIPFTEVIDVDNITPQMHTEISYSLCNMEVNRLDDSEESLVELTGELCALIKGYDEASYEVFTDAYCPDYSIDVVRNNLDILSVKDTTNETFNISERITLKDSNPDIVKIYNISVKPVIEGANTQNGYATVDGYLDAKILYLSSNENLPVYSLNSKIPFSFKVENKGINPKSILDIQALAEHSSYVIKSEREVEVRASVRLMNKILEESSKTIVSDITVNEEEPINKKDQSGITIYFADKDENLWDIAKHYKTTVEEISEVNNIEKDAVFTSRKQLIIPKRSIN